MSTLTLQPPVELVLTLDPGPAPTPALQSASWLAAAIEALRSFRDRD